MLGGKHIVRAQEDAMADRDAAKMKIVKVFMDYRSERGNPLQISISEAGELADAIIGTLKSDGCLTLETHEGDF
jgi:hypothetical protein